eukprot:TRINITY_DN3227_c0_g1_i1.p1 TRINITY_DN3227_c0_g1~~TRINITY_DN3227_c0_g1_i1.p1  ORF type:complete len:315 (-),score=120.12 TRINITY_DN3227_c0_g1_i1:120-1064(-)
MPPANELVFAYELHPRAETLRAALLAPPHLSSLHAVDGPLSEAAVWSLTTQLLTAVAAVHAANLVLRTALSPDAVLVTGRHRVRIGRLAEADAFDADGGALGHAAGSARLAALQREDLGNLGRLLGVLVSRGPAAGAADAGRRAPELTRLVSLLVGGSARTTVADVLSFIAPRLAAESAAVWSHADATQAVLHQEYDASRLLRLSSLLGFINERADDASAATGSNAAWSETADRYLLKLFRDYVFHQVDTDGRPLLDYGHVIECLSRLDVGSPETVLLSSRDGAALILASYAELQRCLRTSLEDLRMQANAHSR